MQKDDQSEKQTEYEKGPKASYGYGGKFGVEKDRMDKVPIIHNTALKCIRFQYFVRKLLIYMCVCVFLNSKMM